MTRQHERSARLDDGIAWSSPALPSLTNPTQSRVYGYIRAHPGVHLRKISRQLGLAIGDVQYHIHRLERDGAIKSVRRGLYRFFYASSLVGDDGGAMLAALSQDTPRELLLHLVESPASTQEDLAQATGLSQPSISWHMKRLAELGVIRRRQNGRFVSYHLVGDVGEMASFVRNYHPSVWERWSARLAGVMVALSAGKDSPEA